MNIIFSFKNLIADSSTQSAFSSSVDSKPNIYLIKRLGEEMAKAEGQDVPPHSSDLGFLNAYCQTLSFPFCLAENKPQF